MTSKFSALLKTAVVAGLLTAQTANAQDTAPKKACDHPASCADKNGCPGMMGDDKNGCKGMDAHSKSSKKSCKNGCSQEMHSKKEAKKEEVKK